MTHEMFTTIAALRQYLPVEENNEITRVLDIQCITDEASLKLIFWIVWEWATKQEWWDKFVAQNGDYQLDEPAAGLKECGWVDTYIIDPTRFPKLITDFLRERQKGEGDGAKSR